MRESGNFSFVRIYDSGHQVPYFQRKYNHNGKGVITLVTSTDLDIALASQVLFQRALDGMDLSLGKVSITSDYSTNGSASDTHTNTLPVPTGLSLKKESGAETGSGPMHGYPVF